MTIKEIWVPILRDSEPTSELVRKIVAEYEEKGFRLQSEPYQFGYKFEEGGPVSLYFTKLEKTPDGSPVLCSLIKFSGGDCEMVFVCLELGEYLEDIAERLKDLPVGERLCCTIG